VAYGDLKAPPTDPIGPDRLYSGFSQIVAAGSFMGADLERHPGEPVVGGKPRAVRRTRLGMDGDHVAAAA
jgi:hypothetical protein